MTSQAPTCPFAGGRPFDPLQIDQVIDPHPWLSAARREAPVFYMPAYDLWCVTRHEDVLAVLRDTETFSSKRVLEPRMLPGLDAVPYGHPMAGNLVNTDPPEHTRLRRFAQRAVTPRLVASYEPRTREIADRLVDAFAQSGSVDLVQSFTRDLASEAVLVTVGVPNEKAEDFRRYELDLMVMETSGPPPPPEDERRVVRDAIRFNEWLVELIEARRRDPQGDFTSQLIHAQSDDGAPSLTTGEVVRVVRSVLTAGPETIASAIAMSVYQLLEDRSRWQRILADPALIPKTVEECLRLEGPVHGVRRDVLRDTVIGGVAIPAGATLYVHYTSASRDESVFEEPHAFNPDRDDLGQHLAFGRWTHFCLGAPLARMAMKVALEALSATLPGLRLADDPGPEVVPSLMGLFPTSLRVVWDA